MAEEVSVSARLKKLERYIYNLKAARELNTLGTTKREAMIALRNNVSNARMQMEAYNNADDTAAMAGLLSLSIELLKHVREDILKASQYDLMDTVDVAHLSALNEQIIEQLQ